MSAQQLPQKQFVENLRERVIGYVNTKTLVIGDISKWMSEGRSMPDVHDLSYVEFASFSVATLEDIYPDVILSPLVTDSFDAFQVIEILNKFDFYGRYRAIAPSLPNLAMVRSEITAVAPRIDFDLVVMPPTLVSVS